MDTEEALEWMEMRWVVSIHLIDITSSFLFSIGADGVQEEYVEGQKPPPRQPWDTGPLPKEPSQKVLLCWWNKDQAKQIQDNWLQLLQDNFLSSYSLDVPIFKPYVSQNWSQKWTEHFHRHDISSNLSVAPPWLAQKGDVIIEPGIAFGTGEHPTTFSCMEALAEWLMEDHSLLGQRCLDVGCGSGILALVAAHLGMNSYGIDIEEDAITAAYKNAEVNNLQEKVQFECRDIKTLKGDYPIVVANLYAEVLVSICDDILRLATGKIALAGILVEKEDMVQDAFAPRCSLLRRKVEEDWVSLWFVRN
jgi:ribosomal protein L11 methyltransferase